MKICIGRQINPAIVEPLANYCSVDGAKGMQCRKIFRLHTESCDHVISKPVILHRSLVQILANRPCTLTELLPAFPHFSHTRHSTILNETTSSGAGKHNQYSGKASCYTTSSMPSSAEKLFLYSKESRPAMQNTQWMPETLYWRYRV
jgi:hypothetical protein